MMLLICTGISLASMVVGIALGVWASGPIVADRPEPADEPEGHSEMFGDDDEPAGVFISTQRYPFPH
ncbi:MAG: hypothetical protein ACYDCI_00355 [Candidatus Limnocylindrales bacterium]